MSAASRVEERVMGHEEKRSMSQAPEPAVDAAAREQRLAELYRRGLAAAQRAVANSQFPDTQGAGMQERVIIGSPLVLATPLRSSRPARLSKPCWRRKSATRRTRTGGTGRGSKAPKRSRI
jgi:hypothetical protein